jgi:choline dehydrogenase-like flavoprotein
MLTNEDGMHARMGNDPATSVCDANCEVHDIKNLYVTDASVLPSAGAVNTCLTIVAVALKAADAVLAKR